MLTAPADVAELLRSCPVVAVLGAHHEPARPAFYVPEYLHRQGYTILPVNPALAGQRLWGRPVVASLDELEVRPDLIDVFRRAEALPAHVAEIVNSRPRAVWLQLGIRHDQVAQALVDEGIDVVQDRCTYADHRAWRIGPPAR